MTTANPDAPDAIVYPKSPSGFRVAPPAVWKRAGDVFTILNATSVTIHVSFPELRMDPPAADVAPRTRQPFRINAETAPGVYEYHVTITAITEKLVGFDLRASAGSDPRIIID